MRLSLSRVPHPRQGALEQDTTDNVGSVGMVYGCQEEGCDQLALQSCVRCGQPFCTQHIRAWERDLPVRGLKLHPPDWYCYQCRSVI